MKKKINKGRLLRRIVIAFLLTCILGFYVANRKLKTYGYDGVLDLILTYKSNSNLAKNVDAEIIQLKLSDSDYDYLKNRRQIALDRGLQINDGDNYVPCSIISGAENSSGEMRLKGHMTDHLMGDKWSFRVKSENEILGMYRFSLQHPGTRNYVYEWIYHQLLKHEDVIYLKYEFVNLHLNEKDLGIYALEEHFGQHVLDRNNRPKGAILRWNPSLYWEWRIDELQGVYLDEEYSSYSSSFAEPYDKGVVLKDKELIENYQIASLKLEQFRRGILKTSEVFDVERMARFHAIIDLVGGQHSLDWSDVKFYYNSKTEKIEPVGYESFSIRKTENIAGQQIINSYDEVQEEYHAQLFSDPIFFEAYIRNLERIASESYIKDFQDKIQYELNKKIGIIAKEWPHRKFNFDGYFENIRLIRNNLELPKPFHAFVQSNNSDSITLSLAPVSDFPIEIIALKKKNKEYVLDNKLVLPPKARRTMIKYFDVTYYGKFKKIDDLVILAKIPGSSNIFEVEVVKYPSYKSDCEKIEILNEESKWDTSMISVKNKKVTFKEQESVINEKMIVPVGYDLVLYPGQKIILNDELIIYGTLNSHGYTDDYVIITTGKSGEVKVFGSIIATNTQFTGHKLISSNNADINLYQCLIYDVSDYFIKDFQSKIVLNYCSSGNVNKLCELNETTSFFSNCNFNNSTILFEANASLVNLRNNKIDRCNSISNLNYNSQFYMWSSTISDSDTMFRLTNSSSFTSYSSELSDFLTGFVLLSNDEKLQGESDYLIYKTTTDNFKTLDIKL